jgi:hypothetical protein
MVEMRMILDVGWVHTATEGRGITISGRSVMEALFIKLSIYRLVQTW